MKFMRFGLVLGFLLTPTLVLAANTGFLGPIVPTCPDGGMCQACNLVQLAQNILRFMVTLSVFAAAVMFAYAGFLYVTAASNHSHLDSARKIFANTLIGLIFILCAYLIIDLTLKVFTGQSLSVWSNIQCVQAVRTGPVGVQFIPAPDTVSPGGVTGAQGGATGGGTTAVPGKGLNNVDSNTNYDPGMGGGNDGLLDAYNKPIVTAQDNLNCRNAGGTAATCAPVTVAVPRQSGISKTQNFTWPELAARYGLPADTVFAPTDRYAPTTGYTTRGTYSVDVARCSSTNWTSSSGCTLGTKSFGNKQVMTTKPTLVTGR